MVRRNRRPSLHATKKNSQHTLVQAREVTQTHLKRPHLHGISYCSLPWHRHDFQARRSLRKRPKNYRMRAGTNDYFTAHALTALAGWLAHLVQLLSVAVESSFLGGRSSFRHQHNPPPVSPSLFLTLFYHNTRSAYAYACIKQLCFKRKSCYDAINLPLSFQERFPDRLAGNGQSLLYSTPQTTQQHYSRMLMHFFHVETLN